MADTQIPAEEAKNRFETITLSEPIRRGETAIGAINIRKPKSGELRGLTLQDVLTTDISAVLKLIPRVTDPPLTQDEVDNLEPEDLAEIGGTIRGFFMTKAERQAIAMLIAEHQPKT